MDNNSDHQQFLFLNKFSSLNLGVASIILVFGGLFILGLGDYPKLLGLGLGLTIFCYGIVFLLSISGLIKGTIEIVKLPRKKVAIMGLLLCLAGLATSIIIGSWQALLFIALGT